MFFLLPPLKYAKAYDKDVGWCSNCERVWIFHLTREGIHSNSISTFSLLSTLLGSRRECKYVWFWREALHFPCSSSFLCAVASWLCDALLFVPTSLDAAWVAPVILNYCINKSCKCDLWHCWNLSLRSSFPMKSMSKRLNGTAASLLPSDRVVAQRHLLDNTLLYGHVMQPPGCAECRVPCRGVLNTCAYVSFFPLCISCLLLWLLGYSTQQCLHVGTLIRFTPGKHNNSVAADFWDVETALIPLCVTEWQGCMVLSLPGGMSLGRESVLQALTQTRSLSRVSGRNQIVQTCPYHFSIGCLTKIKVKLRGRKYTLLNILEWNPKVTSSQQQN